jgi:lantibiotic transport system ATP-binding protein
MTLAIETSGLSHHFASGLWALRDVSLQVPRGSIYGFLGLNGAGKTTTLRLILGLLAQQHGDIVVLGQRLETQRVQVLRRVGASIETPSLYGQLTARENLRVWQSVYDCPRQRIDQVLEQVGLREVGATRAAAFSLGMKQRLALAIALLHEPELLILDEPTNGLDPAGIIELRALLLRLNHDRGTTIIVSSHLLAEIERLVTHVGIINAGALVFQGTLAGLQQTQRGHAFTLLDCDDNGRALRVATALGHAAHLRDGKIVLPPLEASARAKLTSRLVEEHLAVHEVAPRERDLESIFRSLVDGASR